MTWAFRMVPLRDTELISRKLANLAGPWWRRPPIIERTRAAGDRRGPGMHSCLRYLSSAALALRVASGERLSRTDPFDTDDSGSISSKPPLARPGSLTNSG